jgi:hypothetical protein
MNIYYYFFYKISRVLNKKENNDLGPIVAITFFPLATTIPILVYFIPDDVTNLKNIYGVGIVIFCLLFYILNSVLFLNKKRRREIQKRFQGEPLRSKRIGSIIVLLYIIFAIASIFMA